ncbi:MAG TPA: CDP-glucose 4,6-dehydratase [Mariprofundaceae bacterium]|nr:CDP-glucose 4,6-dehydratase [Mariprofundaceae bacterium]
MEDVVMSDCFDGIYRGKRVLLTGHTGFKGSWLALWLAELGAEVHGYALAPATQPSLFEVAGVEGLLASHRIADVRDHATLRRCLQEEQPEIVFHLAAQPLVRLSYREPRETYETNVMGAVNLLEAVRQCDSVRVCQMITSDKCYENHEWVYAYRENDPMGGFDPYSNSKGCSELVVSAFRQSFFHPDRIGEHGVSLASARAGNVIGGGDWAEDRIIPDCARALSKDETIQVRSPHAIRPWQHVLEPLSGYLWLAAKQWQTPGEFEGGWNFGPTGAGNVDVRRIVELAVEAWGEGQWHAPEMPHDRLHEASFLKLDITKASSLLAWGPVCSVPQAVADTIKWYKAFHDTDGAMSEFTLKQIQEYTDRAGKLGLAWAGNGEVL